ncbi:hypothetical protein HOY82DRAFT_534957 [Tuber indicum]|nr:hypothetical protein HOY82DRAFT_534957 [Tuber indicum]
MCIISTNTSSKHIRFLPFQYDYEPLQNGARSCKKWRVSETEISQREKKKEQGQTEAGLQNSDAIKNSSESGEKIVVREDDNAGFEDSVLLSDHGLEEGNNSDIPASRQATSELPFAAPETDTYSDSHFTAKNSISKPRNPSRAGTSGLKRTLPSQIQHSKDGRDNELAKAWLTGKMAKNERKKKRDELEQERLDRKFQQELEFRKTEMAHEERMMEKKIELA